MSDVLWPQLLLGVALGVTLIGALSPVLNLPEHLVKVAARLSPRRRQDREMEWLSQLDELTDPWSRLFFGLTSMQASVTIQVTSQEQGSLRSLWDAQVKALQTALLIVAGLILLRLLLDKLKTGTFTPYTEQDGRLVAGPNLGFAQLADGVNHPERFQRRSKRRSGYRALRNKEEHRG